MSCCCTGDPLVLRSGFPAVEARCIYLLVVSKNARNERSTLQSWTQSRVTIKSAGVVEKETVLVSPKSPSSLINPLDAVYSPGIFTGFLKDLVAFFCGISYDNAKGQVRTPCQHSSYQ